MSKDYYGAPKTCVPQNAIQMQHVLSCVGIMLNELNHFSGFILLGYTYFSLKLAIVHLIRFFNPRCNTQFSFPQFLKYTVLKSQTNVLLPFDNTTFS